MPSSSTFHFDEPVLERPPARRVEVPAGLVDKARLLDELSSRLSFPDYFGRNWDALDECLRDLSWLPPGVVVIRHADLPLASEATNLATYLSILSDAKRALATSDERELVIVFPDAARDRVVALLDSL